MKNTITIDQLTSWLKVPSIDEAMKEDHSDNEEQFNAYYDAVVNTSKYLFEQHNLYLESKKPFIYCVQPVVSWKDSANEIIETINGVGMFEFLSVKEFLESGPYTPMMAVMNHLHWIPDWVRVYGRGTAADLVYQKLR